MHRFTHLFICQSNAHILETLLCICLLFPYYLAHLYAPTGWKYTGINKSSFVGLQYLKTRLKLRQELVRDRVNNRHVTWAIGKGHWPFYGGNPLLTIFMWSCYMAMLYSMSVNQKMVSKIFNFSSFSCSEHFWKCSWSTCWLHIKYHGSSTTNNYPEGIN